MDFRTIKPTEQALRDVESEIKAGRYVSGPFIGMVEKMMSLITGKEYAVATDSGTSALKVALRANGVTKDDRVAIPDLTFMACDTAVREVGATPLYSEVDDNGLMRWPLELNDLKAVMPVFLGGQKVEVPDDLSTPVILDCAHYLGKVDHDACFSFYPSKIIPSFGGGCYVTDSKERADLARRLIMFGFEEGTRETAQVLGFKGYMSNVSAVMAWHELTDLPKKLEVRSSIKNRINIALGLEYGGLGMYLVEVNDPNDEELLKNGFIRHWPRPISEMIDGTPRNENAKRIANHIISTPFHEYMSDTDVDTVVQLLQDKTKEGAKNGHSENA